MEKKPLISILTVVFNQRPYIDQTIRSVLSQTYQNWEWIILDDGSTDGTGEVIKKLKDSGIHYISQQHAGGHRFTESCNKALSMCRGEFVALLDGDDYWPEDKLEAQVKSFDRDDIVLSYGECCVVNPRGKKIDYMWLPEDRSIACNDPIGSSLKMFFTRYNFMAVATVVVRRNALVGIGGFIEAKGLFQDFTTWTRLSLEGKFSPIARCLGFYRRHPLSISFNSEKELYPAGFDYLKGFAVRYEERLRGLGFDYNVKSFEKEWQKMKDDFAFYLPYNRTFFMLRIGAFKEAKKEFRKFVDKMPSLKTRLIYFMVIISGLLRVNIVGPVSALNQNVLHHVKALKRLVS